MNQKYRRSRVIAPKLSQEFWRRSTELCGFVYFTDFNFVCQEWHNLVRKNSTLAKGSHEKTFENAVSLAVS